MARYLSILSGISALGSKRTSCQTAMPGPTKLASLVSLIAIGAGIANGKVLSDLTELSAQASFDFIVVGGMLPSVTSTYQANTICRRGRWLSSCQPSVRKYWSQCSPRRSRPRVSIHCSTPGSVKCLKHGSTNRNQGVTEIAVPGFFFFINGTYSWGHTSTPQVGLGGRSMPYTQGRVLGGSSSLSE